MAKSTKVQATSNLELVSADFSAVDTIDVLKKELKGLKTITETQYKTGGMVEGFNTSIQSETKIDNLVRMHSSIIGRQIAYNNSQQVLSDKMDMDLECPVFKINGQSVADLEYDIILRIKVLSVEERKKELEALVKEGEQFLTEKDKFKLYQQRIKKFTQAANDAVE